MPSRPYLLPDLPYDYAALEPVISHEIMELHHDKHHAAYVKGLNQALDKLETARATDDFGTIVGLEKTMAFNLSGHVLHSVFWTNLSPEGGSRPAGEGDLATTIDEQLGSFEACRAQMTSATVTVQGSGWGALVWEPLGRRLLIQQVYDHQGNHGQGTVPLLVIDAWEHAYYLQYRNDRKSFVEAIWDVIDWQDVERRFAAARSLDLAAAPTM